MSKPFSDVLEAAALRVAAALESSERTRLVLAESCTVGLVAAALGQVPGISRFLCGSFVTYRESAKMAWLGIDPASLQRWTDVSAPISARMARAALERTPEADVSAAVTGHLGPGVPADRDGQVFVALARRGAGEPRIATSEFLLQSAGRAERQAEAAIGVLDRLSHWLEEAG